MSFTDTPDFVENANQRDSARPRFYLRPVQNNFKSNLEGRPIFDDLEYVEVQIPGDRLNLVDRPVKEEDKRRWPKHYEHFAAGRDAPLSGTPLTEWAGITRGQAEELAFFKIRSVEDVAGLSDEQLKKAVPMGGYELQQRAKRFLAQAEGNAPLDALAAENRAQKDTIETLQNTVNDLKAAVGAMQRQAVAEATPPTSA